MSQTKPLKTTNENKSSPNDDYKNTIELYKIILEERRSIMAKYIQALAIYLGLTGFVLEKLFFRDGTNSKYPVIAFMTVTNFLAFFAIGYFKKMAKNIFHAEIKVAEKLKMEVTPNLYWGYWLVIIFIICSQALLILFALTN
ncbi:MAG: hypothetical protein M0P61_09460 [Ignavibacteriaceae bacterium]|jgi:hypothetical protein|nr:hypothetical protein [Ignavibacteriaceae bacterium]